MPAYATTALNLDDDAVSRLRARLLAGPGPAAFEPVLAAYRGATGAVADVAEDLAHALRRYDDAHGGAAAGATRAHLDALLQGTRDDAARLARAVVALQDQAAHHATARREVAVTEPVAASGVAAVLGTVLAAPDPAQRSRQALAVYEPNPPRPG